MTEKYFKNLHKITETLTNELKNISENLDQIISFLRKNEITTDKFNKDRKLQIFLNWHRKIYAFACIYFSNRFL